MAQRIVPRYTPSSLAKFLAEEEALALQYFWSHVQKTDTCWIWTGSKDDFGYGRPQRQGFKGVRAHRFSYELHFGPILHKDLCVMHKCDSPSCVNPEHLELGSLQLNTLQRDQRGRNGVMGEKNPHAVLTEEKVIEIRQRYTRQYGEIYRLADEYGVAWVTIRNIVNRITWKHVH